MASKQVIASERGFFDGQLREAGETFMVPHKATASWFETVGAKGRDETKEAKAHARAAAAMVPEPVANTDQIEGEAEGQKDEETDPAKPARKPRKSKDEETDPALAGEVDQVVQPQPDWLPPEHQG